MTMGKSFALALMCAVCLPALQGQTKSPDASAAEPGILKEYDQAIDQVAERAMQSVVEIEVTGYGVPEKDKDSGGSTTGPGTAAVSRFGGHRRPGRLHHDQQSRGRGRVAYPGDHRTCHG